LLAELEDEEDLPVPDEDDDENDEENEDWPLKIIPKTILIFLIQKY
jgi:hypothetical protein